MEKKIINSFALSAFLGSQILSVPILYGGDVAAEGKTDHGAGDDLMPLFFPMEPATPAKEGSGKEVLLPLGIGLLLFVGISAGIYGLLKKWQGEKGEEGGKPGDTGNTSNLIDPFRSGISENYPDGGKSTLTHGGTILSVDLGQPTGEAFITEITNHTHKDGEKQTLATELAHQLLGSEDEKAQALETLSLLAGQTPIPKTLAIELAGEKIPVTPETQWLALSPNSQTQGLGSKTRVAPPRLALTAPKTLTLSLPVLRAALEGEILLSPKQLQTVEVPQETRDVFRPLIFQIISLMGAIENKTPLSPYHPAPVKTSMDQLIHRGTLLFPKNGLIQIQHPAGPIFINLGAKNFKDFIENISNGLSSRLKGGVVDSKKRDLTFVDFLVGNPEFIKIFFYLFMGGEVVLPGVGRLTSDNAYGALAYLIEEAKPKSPLALVCQADLGQCKPDAPFITEIPAREFQVLKTQKAPKPKVQAIDELTPMELVDRVVQDIRNFSQKNQTFWTEQILPLVHVKELNYKDRDHLSVTITETLQEKLKISKDREFNLTEELKKYEYLWFLLERREWIQKDGRISGNLNRAQLDEVFHTERYPKWKNKLKAIKKASYDRETNTLTVDGIKLSSPKELFNQRIIFLRHLDEIFTMIKTHEKSKRTTKERDEERVIGIFKRIKAKISKGETINLKTDLGLQFFKDTLGIHSFERYSPSAEFQEIWQFFKLLQGQLEDIPFTQMLDSKRKKPEQPSFVHSVEEAITKKSLKFYIEEINK
jgi:hypothetical protein